MRARKKMPIIILLAATALAGLLLLKRDREPFYQGRPLSQWLAAYAKHTGIGYETEAERDQGKEGAIEAIRSIGTNGLPILLKRIQYEPSPARLRAIQKLPESLLDNDFAHAIFRHSIGRSESDAELAEAAFVILGSQASPAVPELTKLMCQTNRPEVASRATYCLAAIGKEGLPSLLTALANSQLPCCEQAAHWLAICPADFGTNAAAAIPLLAGLTSSTNEFLAKDSIKALGRIRLEPEIAIPALTNALHAASPGLRDEAEHAIGRFGADALWAEPALLEALNDREYIVRAGATNALLQITPAALK